MTLGPELGKQPDDGWEPGQSDGDPDAWKDDITSACNAINRACDKVGDNSGLTDDLAKVLACLNGLMKQQDGRGVQARVNKSGSTESPIHDLPNDGARSVSSAYLSCDG